MKTENLHENYTYKNLPIKGGGYVTGFIFNKGEKDLLYIRTDIGGSYRFDHKNNTWHCLTDHVKMTDLSESYPIAIASDEHHPERLYIACGLNKKNSGILACSDDYGKSFYYRKIPALVFGNRPGRGTGSRLVIDPNDSEKLYFATQTDGLYMTSDRGKKWKKLETGGSDYMTCVWVSPNSQVVVAGSAGIVKGKNYRLFSLYISYDAGKTFSVMPQDTTCTDAHISKMPGFVAQRMDFDGTFLYVTISMTGARSYLTEEGYSCDSGDATCGRVLKYVIDEEHKKCTYYDITPVEHADFGFSGISSCPQKPGLLICSTICEDDGDSVFRSLDFGSTWTRILHDFDNGRMDFRTPYMHPEYTEGRNIIHWLSDLKINPFNKNEAWFNTGTGVFRTENLLDDTVVFHDEDDGLEETVHLNVYSPVSGKLCCLDILGDLGGFAFTDPDRLCDSFFTDTCGNRYATCINADFSDTDPSHILVTARGDFHDATKGGLIISDNEGFSWHNLPMPYGLSARIDEKLHSIETPNVNPGWAAMSPDKKNIVWSICEGLHLPANLCIVSHDGGQTFSRTKMMGSGSCIKCFSDRVDSSIFYGFGASSQVYISRDGGSSFAEYKPDTVIPKTDFALIDTANRTEIRGVSGRIGEFYIAAGKNGLYRMNYSKETDTLKLNKISKKNDTVFKIGLGIPFGCSDYLLCDTPALYICGIINGQYGFFRSDDGGETYIGINDEMQMFGDINSIDGDKHIPGQFYIGTGTKGILYGTRTK